MYVIYYLYCIGNKKPFDPKWNADTYRTEIAYHLLLRSKNMENICLNCFSKTKGTDVKCRRCSRFIHADCIYKAEVKSDEEEKLLPLMLQKPNRRRKVTSPSFTCKLCMRYDKEKE